MNIIVNLETLFQVVLDLKQTPKSLIPNMIEELYEVVEAIEDGDNIALMEELETSYCTSLCKHNLLLKQEYLIL